MLITKLTAKRILKSAGAERVSEDAAIEFADALNSYAYRVAGKASKLAQHAKRKTVGKADVKLAK
jgi:histone H3/H4